MSESSSLTPGKSLESDLRLIREAKRLTREDVFNRVHIRPEVLTQVEEYGFSATPTLSSDIHRRSFVKHYADAIGIDAAKALQALNKSLEGQYDGSLARDYLSADGQVKPTPAVKKPKGDARAPEPPKIVGEPDDGGVRVEEAISHARPKVDALPKEEAEAVTRSDIPTGAADDEEVTRVTVVSSSRLIDDIPEIAPVQPTSEIPWPIAKRREEEVQDEGAEDAPAEPGEAGEEAGAPVVDEAQVIEPEVEMTVAEPTEPAEVVADSVGDEEHEESELTGALAQDVLAPELEVVDREPEKKPLETEVDVSPAGVPEGIEDRSGDAQSEPLAETASESRPEQAEMVETVKKAQPRKPAKEQRTRKTAKARKADVTKIPKAEEAEAAQQVEAVEEPEAVEEVEAFHEAEVVEVEGSGEVETVGEVEANEDVTDSEEAKEAETLPSKPGLVVLESPYAPPMPGISVEVPPAAPEMKPEPAPAEKVAATPAAGPKRRRSRRSPSHPTALQQPAVIPEKVAHPAERRESWSHVRSRHWVTWLGLLGVLVVVGLFLIRSFTTWLSVDAGPKVTHRPPLTVETLPERFSGFVRPDDVTEEFVTLVIGVTDSLDPGAFEFRMWTHSAGSLYATTGEGSLTGDGEQIALPEPYGMGGIFVSEGGEVRMRSVRRIEFPRWEFTGQMP